MESGRKPSIGRFALKYLFALVGAVYLFTLGLARGGNRAFLAEIAKLAGWREGGVPERPEIPTIDPQKVFSGGPAIEIFDPAGDDGNVSLLELVALNKLIRKQNSKEVFEIGTFDGRTALNFAANSPADAKIYTLDLPDSEIEEARKNPVGDVKFVGRVETGYKFKKFPYAGKVIQLLGDSANFDYGPYKNKVDYIFVDGAHSYEYVKSDTENSLKMIRGGGIIAWHDYNHCDGVTKYLNELYASGGKFKNLRWVEGTMVVVLLPENLLDI